MRLWNVTNGECIAIVGGEIGHREQILSIDFSFDGSRLVTSSIDTCIKIWDLSSLMSHYMETKAISDPKKKIPCIHFPIFNANYLFYSYIDSVKFMGKLVFAKSTTGKISIFEPKYESKPLLSHTLFSEIDLLAECFFNNGSLWFMRLATSHTGRFLAVGNEIGEVYVWDLKNLKQFHDPTFINKPELMCKYSVQQTIPIRELAFYNEK